MVTSCWCLHYADTLGKAFAPIGKVVYLLHLVTISVENDNTGVFTGSGGDDLALKEESRDVGGLHALRQLLYDLAACRLDRSYGREDIFLKMRLTQRVNVLSSGYDLHDVHEVRVNHQFGYVNECHGAIPRLSRRR